MSNRLTRRRRADHSFQPGDVRPAATGEGPGLDGYLVALTEDADAALAALTQALRTVDRRSPELRHPAQAKRLRRSMERLAETCGRFSDAAIALEKEIG